MIKLAIVEDDRIIRQGLQVILDGTEGFKCVGAFDRCETLLREIQTIRPDAVLMDIHLKGGMSGIQGTKEIKTRLPDCVVLIQTVYDEDDKIFDALCAGASGYLLKKTPPARLLTAIQEAMDGGAPMTPTIARRVVDHFRSVATPTHEETTTLTERERDVLRLLENGQPYKRIAETLHISVPTVRFHMGNIYRKLQASSQSEAISKAVRKKLI